MARTILIKETIHCGEKTCYDFATKTRCVYVLVSNFGTQWWCGRFVNKKTGERYLLKDQQGDPYGEGALQRIPECLAAEELAGTIK